MKNKKRLGSWAKLQVPLIMVDWYGPKTTKT